MIVRREDGGWTLIRQMDHAGHCAELARAWRGGPYGRDSVSAALEYAAGYHDLGWTEIDKQPEIDADGRPLNFTQIDEARHTEFYSGAVRTIALADPSAAYLVSLHASGLYSRRFGWAGLKPVDWTAIGPHGRALLKGEREFRSELSESIAPAELEFEAMWRNYMLLETFDYLSLLTCFGFESSSCGPVPTLEGRWEQLAVRRLGAFEIELDPFPFAGDRLQVEVECVHLERPDFRSHDDLRAQVRSQPPQTRRTVYLARSG
ncbi:MAG TPA: DUF3891 family protein [Candidatus Dormibacteraeota bacterium]|jgi:hypothetical protein|nr:DUF3891 family protein [Candidatus Dormibacteraeota bacterium]